MRFAVALVTLLIAGVLVAAGVAQRTIWKPADHATVSTSIPADVHYVVIPGSVLDSHVGAQTLGLAGSGTTFASYGRTADVTAWLSGERYAILRADANGAMLKPEVRTAPTVAGLSGATTPDPDGSDLWLDQRRTQRSLDWKVNLPSSMSMLVASTGSQVAPSSVQLTWPVRTATPLAVPLIAAGGALAVIGLLLYIWALVHLRRRRGPRRKPPAKQPRRPAPPKYRPFPTSSASSAPGRGRRSVRQRVVFGGVAGVAAVLATGCAIPVASPASAASVPQTGAVTEAQATRIVGRVAAVAKSADAKLSATIAAERFGGAALTLRTASYLIRAKDKKADLPQAVPTTDSVVQLKVPEATSSWPRTLFTVVAAPDEKKVAPLALAMVQNDPRSDYVVQYAMSLPRGTQLPNMPNALTGSKRLGPDTPLLRIKPSDLAADYGLLLRDAKASTLADFDVKNDPLFAGVGETAKKKAAKKTPTAAYTYTDLSTAPESIIALSTAASGALVAVELDEQGTVKPKRSGVTIETSGGTKVLSKTASTMKGIRSVYSYQLLFSVPSAGSNEPVTLLGYAQGLVSAKEL